LKTKGKGRQELAAFFFSGRCMPGKLHAKVAVIDDQAVLSRANLTDDAFTRNLEMGTLFSGEEILRRLRGHFDSLFADGS
jgi:cardiolipin synthase